MASTARIFFAGIGTSFLILAVGFSGGLMLARSTLHDHASQTRAGVEPPRGVRVVLPTSAEPAVQASPSTDPLPQIQPVKEVQAPVAPLPEKTGPKTAERELKAERRRYAERKAQRAAAVRARRQVEPQERQVLGIMAFGGDVSRTGFFGN